MRRREFITLLGGAATAWPLAAWAQQTQRGSYRIAMLHPSHPVTELTENSSLPYYRAFFDELRRLGYIEGRNLTVERYSVEGHVENSSAIARSAASRNPDLIFTIGDLLVRALREATSTVPIVVLTRDPVAEGLIQSLARSTGNITGVTAVVAPEIYAKRVQLLREIVPTLSKVGILMVPEPGNFETQTRQIVQTAGVAVVEPTRVESNSDTEYRRVLTAISQAGAEALLINDHVQHVTKRQVIIEQALKLNLPTIYTSRSFVEAGGLMAYGFEVTEILRQGARQIDKVLKGSNPGDIPFYQPVKFELVINLKAAKEIGLTVPPSMLSLADELIE
jgi:putative tryptophan/tyrosine transport system substrate-binding protein